MLTDDKEAVLYQSHVDMSQYYQIRTYYTLINTNNYSRGCDYKFFTRFAANYYILAGVVGVVFWAVVFLWIVVPHFF
jgi:hypothetical protein